MSGISLIILSAGQSSRFGLEQKKQWLRSGTKPFWLLVTQNLMKATHFDEVFVVSDDAQKMEIYAPNFHFVKGGATRQESLFNALKLVKTPWVMTSDAARVGVSKELVENLLENMNNADCIVPTLKCSDSVVLGSEYVNRDELKMLGTPQLSRTDMLKKALESGELYNDDSAAMAALGAKIWYAKGDENAFKLTFKEDLRRLKLAPPSDICLNGHGFDVHRFCDGDFVTLCGEKITHDKGILAHSDGDAPLHALCDALFGAAGLGDIGEFFPDTDERYKGADSLELLKECAKIVRSYGYEIVNADITILCERPKITPHKEQMRLNVASALKIPAQFVNIKATTMEKMGFIGSGEGLGAIASATIKYFDWTRV